MAQQALKVYRVYRVFKEKREIQATRDRRVFKGYKEYKATKVTLEPLVLSEMELILQQKTIMVHLRSPMMMERHLLHLISLLRKRFQMI
jgi:hypothetical protein